MHLAESVRTIAEHINNIAPSWLAEEWDNPGLLIGSFDKEVKSILTCLDVTSEVVDEAVEKKVDLIISHHPLIFKAQKCIRTDRYPDGLIYSLIKNNINLLSAHTNLDFANGGLNDYLAKLLKLNNIKSLKEYKSDKMYKVVVYVPEKSINKVRNAMSIAGAGWIGKYSDCFFSVEGEGTFKPLKGTKPHIGQVDKLESVKECRLETIAEENKLNDIIEVMKKNHPYEEVAYDIYSLNNKGEKYGFGRRGILKTAESFEEFVERVKKCLKVKNVRVIGNNRKKVRDVGVFCGGFDISCLDGTDNKNMDVLVTGEVKYNQAVEICEKDFCVLEAGHFYTERIVVSLLSNILGKKMPKIKIIKSKKEKNPFRLV